MRRRSFLKTAAGAAWSFALPGRRHFLSGIEGSGMSERTYRVLGVPLRSGSIYPGDENDAQAYRDAKLVARLQSAGCQVVDEGDGAIPSYLPPHSVPPIRSWPGPRIAWEIVTEKVTETLRQPGQIPLLIGCDCS